MLTDGVPAKLWKGPAPGRLDWTQNEQWEAWSTDQPDEIVRNVVVPTLTAYLPEQRTDRAVVVCPGGAMHFVSMEYEGRSVAEILRDAGFAAFVVKYRVVPTPVDKAGFDRAISAAFHEGLSVADEVLPLAVADAVRAIELVRADGYRQVTLVGFSAGGRIAAEIVINGEPDRRPDFASIVYLPSLDPCSVPADAPPLFVLAAADDMLGIEGSLALHAAWRAAGAPVELHLFERGNHGFGTKPTGLPVDRWPDLLVSWLESVSAEAP
jgi:acetyl esterase/lipase